MSNSRSIRAVALFEAFKGILALLAATGLLSLVHTNMHAAALKMVEHMHLNPASHYPEVFISWLSNLDDTRLMWISVGAVAYACLRLIEAYGLFFGRAWAEVLAAISSSVYIPFEVMDLHHRATWHGAILLVVNIVIVFIMLHALLTKGRGQRQMPGNLT